MIKCERCGLWHANSKRACRRVKGQCFKHSAQYMLDHPGDHLILVHAFVRGADGDAAGQTYAHAWVERKCDEAMPGLELVPEKHRELLTRTAIDVTTIERKHSPMELPAVVYRGVGQARGIVEYTREAAMRFMRYTKHYGPWELNV